MFLIIPPASISSFLPYAHLVVMWYPHWVASLSLLIFYIICPRACVWCLRVACIVSMRPTVISVVIYIFSVGSFGRSSFIYRAILFCWILSPWWSELLLIPLGCAIVISGIKYGPPSASNEWTGPRLSLSDQWKLNPRLLLPTQNSWKRLPFYHVYIGGAPISRLSCRLFELFPGQAWLLEMCLETNPCEIITCIFSWFRMRSLGVIFLYQIYSQYIKSTK